MSVCRTHDHSKAELQAVWCRAYARTNITSFVNAVDVFNDWLLIQLYAHDPSLGRYAAGGIGSILSSTRLKTAYPRLTIMITDIHNQRYGSHLSQCKDEEEWQAEELYQVLISTNRKASHG